MKRKNPFVLKAIKCAEIIALLLSLSVFASSDTQPSKTEKPNSKTEYRLSVYDGRIAAFESSETKPFEIFDVYVSSLPYNEQVELINGITAADKIELQQLIEDYTS